MHYNALLAITAIGLIAVSALPTEEPQFSGSLQARTEEKTTRFGLHSYLNVPMLYAGWVSKDGRWERYACEDEKDCKKEDGDDVRGIGTKGLASCVDISIVSKEGAISTHVPPYLCPYLPNAKPNPALGKPDEATKKKQKKQLDMLKNALKKLFKDHKDDLKKYRVEVVVGEQGVGRPEDAAQLVKELFGESSFEASTCDVLPLERKDEHGTMHIEFDDGKVKFYVEDNEKDLKLDD